MTPLIIIFICLLLTFAPAWAALTKPPLMLASTGQLHTLSNKPSAYIVSEKLDGIRAYWTGKKLLSRAGKRIAAPAWFTDKLPNIAIEGELWIDRGEFQALVSITTKQQPIDTQWRRVKFMLFDMPHSNLNYQQRLIELNELVASAQLPFLQVVPYQSYQNIEQIEQYLQQTIAKGGEGIMLNLANSLYFSGRQKQLVKIKPYYDAEAVVIDHIAGTGKLKNLMGSLLVKDKQGKVFKIGTGFSMAERRDPPKFGQTITYKYSGVSKSGKPKFASFLRIKERL